MESGERNPVAVLARRGSGKVVQFSIPYDTEWTSLLLRLVFLPMIQQLVLVGRNQEQVNVDVGDGLAIATKSGAVSGENQGLNPPCPNRIPRGKLMTNVTFNMVSDCPMEGPGLGRRVASFLA